MSIMNVSRTLRAPLCFASAHARRPFYRRAERKRLELAYGDDRVSIERGASGAPCITARSEPAVYFGQGYAMALDRLWQMDILRREATGRLAEILGTPALSLDRYHRTSRLDHDAAASVRLVGAEDNTLLSAFCDGVNAAIAQLARDPVRRPVEFDLLGYSPEPWQPADTFAVLKLMALQLGMNAKYKTLMHELGRAFSADAVDALVARATTHDYATLTGAALARDGIDVPIRAFGQTIDLSGLLPVLGQASATGSNAWVVGGKHTRSGYPILCNDPHLPFMLPAIFHQARLRCTDPDNRFDASGVNVPGLPGLISGHNADVAGHHELAARRAGSAARRSVDGRRTVPGIRTRRTRRRDPRARLRCGCRDSALHASRAEPRCVLPPRERTRRASARRARMERTAGRP